MKTLTTHSITINVETFFQHEYSDTIRGEYMFCYRILIENHNVFPVQLLSRHWNIYDCGNERIIEGEGVIGAQPILQEGDEYQYVSGSNVHSEMARQEGYYMFKNLLTEEIFTVTIPTFVLVYPPLLN